ncbi:glycosyltransferase family 4 protein [Roseiconus nitratireducens]|uniref:Glycosyltransferase family 4 protein n=1 Tax=Roseiconus nitratireducens TaxID=2605748 RepID=A0A5M6DLN2_9BACT|nr:glycosyltransferase [Roseiconus nitratireducens]KAA5546265.1 glycosyltransferase family 4 protein [Roseiconus nitratireducens]
MPDQALPRLLSVCMTLPTSAKPQQGLFVYRRLEAISRTLPVRALCPVPWFPGLKGGSIPSAPADARMPIDCRRMFYLPGIAKSLDGRWMQRCIRRWVQEMDPKPERTVLDAHFGYPEGVAVHRVARRLGVPFLITLRGVEEEWLQKPRVRDQMLSALEDASAVIAVSESLRQAAARAGADPERIRVIANGCDTSMFGPGDRKQARLQLGIEDCVPLLVTVATLKHVKGHDRLVEPLRRLSEHLDFRWICIGDTDDSGFTKGLRDQIAAAGISDRVLFTGPLPPHQVSNYLRAADLFLLASRREGSCNAILEAMSCGTPVVATPVGDNRELESRFDGIRVADADVPESFFKELMACLINDPKPAFDAADPRMPSVAALPQDICPSVTTNATEFQRCSSVSNSSSKNRTFQPRSWQDVGAACIGVIREVM